MIKIDELREFRPQVRYQNGNGITLITVQDAIKDCAMNMGIPIAFKYDKVKLGGLFNSSVDDCLSPFYGSMPHTALWEAASSSRRSAAFLLP